jgi:hypothetical protein
MLDLYISTRELSLVSGVCRTNLFKMKKHGQLSPPTKWCGNKKAMFHLQKACNEIARLNEVPELSEDSIRSFANKILDIRTKANRFN